MATIAQAAVVITANAVLGEAVFALSLAGMRSAETRMGTGLKQRKNVQNAAVTYMV
jgi:hypothetical protein